MYYNAIHARSAESGEYVVVASGFSELPGHPSLAVVEKWQEFRTDPLVGATYLTLQRFMDNNLVEVFNLKHPDAGAEEQQRLRAGEAERAESEKKASIMEIRRALFGRGLTVKDLASADTKDAPDESLVMPPNRAVENLTAPAPPPEKSSATPPATDQPEEAESDSPSPAAAEPRTSRLKKSSS